MSEKDRQDEGLTRRDLLKGGPLAGVAAMAGLLAIAGSAEPARGWIQRPPGALPGAAFSSRCIKCGQCLRACPYNAIRMAEPGSGAAPGTPYLAARDVPCYMCADIPCAKACPSGALDRTMSDIAKARMGLAVLAGRETCLALQGLRCEVCYNACPVTGKAITLEYRINERTGVHAVFEPVVHSDHCTGCGKCEHACVLDLPAIRVMDPAAAQGEVGHHYRFGWKKEQG